MSVAITGGYNLVQQAIANDGDLTNLDYNAAFKFISTEEFWAGTAGSFTGGMDGAALTSFLPGPFKVLEQLQVHLWDINLPQEHGAIPIGQQ